MLNWSFLQAGMCDEVSLVVAPRRRRQPQHPIPLPGQGGAEHRRPPLSFTLLGAETSEGSTLWLRYRVNYGPATQAP